MLWLVPALPLLGFVLLSMFGRRMLLWGAPPAPGTLGHGRPFGIGVVGAIAVGSVAASFLVVLASPVPTTSVLGTWFSVGELTARFALRLDPLSATWALVITGIGALIHLYAVEYLRGDPGFARFFAYMNLFVAAMTTLVLADDLLLLYLGWEGVGLCSYLLIGFWTEDPANGRAARKAFVVTRIGDVGLMIALLILATTRGTLAIPEILAAPDLGRSTTIAVSLLLLLGAAGKSAQLPLHVWLPDAMAGPTPVSALIHAATMVTAGVYLLARMHPLIAQAPLVMDLIAWVGTGTMLVGGLAALAQYDLKRILAYSTMSQLGLMFVAIGVGAPDAAVFHFVTHAAFKALLFLAAGSVILAMHHDQDLRHMGGLWRVLPVPFWTFLIGSLALAGLPLVTAGFYSKDAVITSIASDSWTLWTLAIASSLLTSLYIFRAVFHVFFGARLRGGDGPPEHRPSWQAVVPLVTLAALTVIGGVFGPETAHGPEAVVTAIAASLASILGVYLAWRLVRRPGSPPIALETAFGFDLLYDELVIRPFVGLGRWNRTDRLGRLYDGLASSVVAAHRALAATQSGRIRTYLAVIATGAALLLGMALWGTP